MNKIIIVLLIAFNCNIIRANAVDVLSGIPGLDKLDPTEIANLHICIAKVAAGQLYNKNGKWTTCESDAKKDWDINDKTEDKKKTCCAGWDWMECMYKIMKDVCKES